MARVQVFNLVEYFALGEKTNEIASHCLPLVVRILLVLVKDAPELVDKVEGLDDDFDPFLRQLIRVASEEVLDHGAYRRLYHFLKAEDDDVRHLNLLRLLENLDDVLIALW